jgi:hypothetical protein
MDNQRIRNLTTGCLHTSMEDMEEDLCFLTGYDGLLDMQLPRVKDALIPFLKDQLGENSRFFDGKYDITHTGNTLLRPLFQDELLQLKV